VLEDPKATRFTLDGVAAQHLVLLTAWTGHGALVNTAALRRLGLKEDEPDPPGGFFVRVPGQKTLIGIAHEYATDLLRRRIGAMSNEETQIAVIRNLNQQAASFGSLPSNGCSPAAVSASPRAEQPLQTCRFGFGS
jgi:predicted amidohydrolase YtcJ